MIWKGVIEMLNDLKKALRENTATEFCPDAILESTTSVKDAFLDDPETDLIGAEDDPEIRDLIETIPEYGGSDEDTEQDIEALTESLSATATRPSAHTADTLKRELLHHRDQDKKLQSELDFYKKRSNDYQVNRIQTAIIANDKKISDLESQIRSL
jgi:hypothetical protein